MTTTDDLNILTRMAINGDRSRVLPYADRYELAWSAIAEELCANPAADRRTLVLAGIQGIYTEVRASRHHHGYANRVYGAGWGSAPRFAAYWSCTAETGYEEDLTEQLALPALLSALTPTQRRVVDAYATWGRAEGAVRLGMTARGFAKVLVRARRTCQALWLQGETPHRTPGERPDATRANARRCRHDRP